VGPVAAQQRHRLPAQPAEVHFWELSNKTDRFLRNLPEKKKTVAKATRFL
jgi:hypothetical protein